MVGKEEAEEGRVGTTFIESSVTTNYDEGIIGIQIRALHLQCDIRSTAISTLSGAGKARYGKGFRE